MEASKFSSFSHKSHTQESTAVGSTWVAHILVVISTLKFNDRETWLTRMNTKTTDFAFDDFVNRAGFHAGQASVLRSDGNSWRGRWVSRSTGLTDSHWWVCKNKKQKRRKKDIPSVVWLLGLIAVCLFSSLLPSRRVTSPPAQDVHWDQHIFSNSARKCCRGCWLAVPSGLSTKR